MDNQVNLMLHAVSGPAWIDSDGFPRTYAWWVDESGVPYVWSHYFDDRRNIVWRLEPDVHIFHDISTGHLWCQWGLDKSPKHWRWLQD